jgi:succinate dehydrogenase/fumarate reductase flavoprotein subunit
VASRVIEEMPRIFRKLELFGVDFKDRKLGTYYRLRSFGLPGTYHINFDGTDFKKCIGERVRKGKAQVLMRTMVIQLLVRDNAAYGAIAFNFRSGEWIVIRAKAVVLAAGDVNRIARNASGLAFDSWHFPYNTGDAQAMGYRAGAMLANMESVEATLTPKGFSCQGLNALVSLGAYFVNKHGERFMFRYDAKGENARRAVLADAAINEYLLGNGPVYLDCRHLPDEMLDRMAYTLQVDRYTLPAYYQQKGVDFRTELVEISVSELSIRRSGVYFRGSGLAVDIDAETSIDGLFAAGDCATVSGGIAGAAVLGHIAGEAVVRRVRSQSRTVPALDRAVLDELRGRSAHHLEGADGLPWKQFEDEVRDTVTDYVGVRRTESGLRRALATLQSLAHREPELKADDLHGLMRVHEACNVRLNAEIMAAASLVRTETRTGSSHWRVDYPETDEVNWRQFVLVASGDDGPAVSTLSTEQPLSAAFGRSAVAA